MTNWNQVDPSYPDVPLKLYGAGTDSGTFDYFTDVINGEEGASRTDFSATEDDNVTVQGVSGDKGALGYFGFSYFEENQDKLKALEVDGGGGCVAPSVEAAQDGSYTPLSRPLFMYVKLSSLEDNESVARVRALHARERARRSRRRRSSSAEPGADRRAAAEARGRNALDDDGRRHRRPAGGAALPRKKIRWGEQFVHLVLFIAAAISVLTTVGIVLSLVLPALDFFREVSPWDFFTGTTWAPLFLDAKFGVLPLVVGTLVISFWSALVAFPLGLGVAIYLSEYAAPRATAFLKPILEILAAIPTVVLGYFALTLRHAVPARPAGRAGRDLQRARRRASCSGSC